MFAKGVIKGLDPVEMFNVVMTEVLFVIGEGKVTGNDKLLEPGIIKVEFKTD
jgi:hypothetical protein